MIKSKRIRWVGYVARTGEKRNVFRLLVGEPDGKSPLRRSRCRWVDNIKMELEEIVLRVLTELVWLKIVISGELL
jgi:hypothetical protein